LSCADLTTKSLILHMIDCWIHHNEAPSYILSSHYQYTRVPWLLGLISHQMEGDHMQAPPCEFSGWSEWNQKKNESPNLVIRVTWTTKYSVIWLLGWPK
jgi:hypothetical protein